MKHRLFWPMFSPGRADRPQHGGAPAVHQDHRARRRAATAPSIDILRNSAPLMLVALGMTLVIATRGIDLSVGAVMAVSGAVTLTHHRRLAAARAAPARCSSRWSSASASRSCSALWNGFLVAVLQIQPIIATLVLMLAGRGVALLITGGFITTVNSEPLNFVASGYLFALPFAFFISVAAVAVVALVERRTALGVLTEAVGINPEASRLAGVRSRGIIFGAYVASGTLAGIAGIIYSLEHQGRRRQRRRRPDRALRDPGRRAGRHLAHGRQVQHRRHGDRRADHPDPRVDDPVPRGLLGAEPGLLRRRRDHRRADPVAPGAPDRAEASPRGSRPRDTTEVRSDAEVAA